MNHRLKAVVLVAAAVSLGGCMTVPTGPSVLVLPGPGKTFDQFQADNAVCRQFARMQTGGATASQTANESTLKSAGVGALLGGALGAALGEGRGAAIGAASGAALGTAVGSSNGTVRGLSVQQRYDYAYEQCMYAKGNRIPVAGRFQGPRRHHRGYYPPPPPPGAARRHDHYPPPPPGGDNGD
jgi:outer membrane lipoprotein SlyB